MTKSKELVSYSWKPLSPEASTFPHTHTHNIVRELQEPSTHSHLINPLQHLNVQTPSDEEADQEVAAICRPSEQYWVRSHLRRRHHYFM